MSRREWRERDDDDNNNKLACVSVSHPSEFVSIQYPPTPGLTKVPDRESLRFVLRFPCFWQAFSGFNGGGRLYKRGLSLR